MAQLPPDGQWLIQQSEGIVRLFNRHTDDLIVSFDPCDGDAAAKAQAVIARDVRLSDEQRAFAHFWSGYFYAHATVR
jgi:hypothetical protein